MIIVSRSARRAGLLCLALLVGSCGDFNVARIDAPVVPVTVGETAQLSAPTVAEAMLRAGFTADEILANGPALRNAISTTGGAQVRRGTSVAALFSVSEGYLYVASQTSGTFSMPLPSN